VRRTLFIFVAVAGVPILPSAASVHAVMPPPSTFSARVDNPWYPLRPGSVYIYQGAKDGKRSRDVLTVTHSTRKVDGVPCVVVEDRLYLDGVLEERTTEWYSEDVHGNVWYFGEDTAELDTHGHVTTTSGSWQAGVQGARPGVFMYARPRVGQAGRQELLEGQAEDRFQVVSLHASVRVPFVSSRDGLLTKEWTPLEPGVLDHKVYVRGIGDVLELTVQGGNERAALVSFRRG
jgi:hypothetical protein